MPSPAFSLRIAALLAAASPFAGMQSVAGVPVRPPNVVLIVSDNQAWGDLGCFGSKEIITPNLDRIAAEGVKATNFYITSAACTPSRGSILTGRYPQRNGLYDMIRNYMVDYKHRYTLSEYAISEEMTQGLDLREITLGQLMKGGGYTTGAVGKWDSGRARRFRPTQRGFDFYYGFLVSGADYWTGERYGIPSTYRNNDLETPHGFSEELFTQEAMQFIERSQKNPFFLYLAYHAPAGNASLDTKDRRIPKKYLDLYANRPNNARTQYMAVTTCMDDGIGRIMAELKALNLEQNTLVIFFPDNGWAAPNGDPGPHSNGQGDQDNRLGDAGIRTCFVARWPGVLPAGATCDEFISNLEIFPTLAAAAGIPIPAGVVLDGFNLLPVLQGRMPSPRTEMFWQNRSGRAARVGNYKWAETPVYGGLFDLVKDPGETRDLSAQEPDVLAFVKSRWENWRREMDAAEPRGPFRDY